MTPKQQKALLALLENPTKERAAAAAGITSKTLRGYLENVEFQAEYKKAFAGLVETATRQAQQTLHPALSTLKEIMEDVNIAPSARVQACRTALEYTIRLTEQNDIMERLAALEQAVEEEGEWL